MTNELQADLRASYRPKFTFQIHEDYLMSFGALTTAQQSLLMSMVRRLVLTHQPESYIGGGTYKDFGYAHSQSFTRDKNALVESRFIITSSKQYIVRMEAIMYASKRGYDNLCKTMGVMFDPLAFGKKNYIPPVPKS